MISVVINTRNEGKNIARAIGSVKGFADEVVVVDMESSDDTVSIAEKFKARVFPHKQTSYVEPARNYAIKQAKGSWIFVLDADEELTKELGVSLKKVADDDTADFVRIARKNIIFNKWMKHSRWWPDYNVRFFKKGAVTWEDAIHSVPVTNGRGMNIEADANHAIVHHHYETVEQFIDRLNRYTTVQSKELHEKGRTVSFSDFINRPTSEFLSRYFAGEGYKDGMHGLAASLLQSFSELVVYIKLWQLEGFSESTPDLHKVTTEITKAQKDINYWKAQAKVIETGSLRARIQRKLKI